MRVSWYSNSYILYCTSYSNELRLLDLRYESSISINVHVCSSSLRSRMWVRSVWRWGLLRCCSHARCFCSRLVGTGEKPRVSSKSSSIQVFQKGQLLSNQNIPILCWHRSSKRYPFWIKFDNLLLRSFHIFGCKQKVSKMLTDSSAFVTLGDGHGEHSVTPLFVDLLSQTWGQGWRKKEQKSQWRPMKPC